MVPTDPPAGAREAGNKAALMQRLRAERLGYPGSEIA